MTPGRAWGSGADQALEEISPAVSSEAVVVDACSDDPAVIQGHMARLARDVVSLQHVRISGGHWPDETLGLFIVQKLASTLRGVHVHGQKVHAVSVLGVDFLQLPQRGTAYRSPRCVEVEHHRPVLEVAEADLTAFNCRQHEVGGLLSRLMTYLHSHFDRG